MMKSLFFQSYLFSFLFWSHLGIGSMPFLMMYHLTGGAWGKVVESTLIALTRTVYAVALLFIPLLFGLDKIYPWANHSLLLTPRMKDQAIYLNPAFFSIRAGIYFLIWSCLAFFLVRWSERLRSHPDDLQIRNRLKNLSGGGLVLYGYTVSFAAIDWVMSLEPSWSSTVYGMVYVLTQCLSAFAFVLFQLPKTSVPLPKKALNDLGNILLAVIMLWGYVSILQYVIIWSANIPEEALWFNHRTRGGWQYLITCLVALQFAGPFIFLLFKELKRNEVLLRRIGLALLLVRVFDVYWFVMPAFHPEGFVVHPITLGVWVLVGAVWLGAYRWSKNE
jgi:hypothetical protein